MNTRDRIKKYLSDWTSKGYGLDIPDEVPHELYVLGLAPSYKAIAIALLKNDMHMESLGFSAPKSHWYGAFKRVELAARADKKENTDS